MIKIKYKNVIFTAKWTLPLFSYGRRLTICDNSGKTIYKSVKGYGWYLFNYQESSCYEDILNTIYNTKQEELEFLYFNLDSN